VFLLVNSFLTASETSCLGNTSRLLRSRVHDQPFIWRQLQQREFGADSSLGSDSKLDFIRQCLQSRRRCVFVAQHEDEVWSVSSSLDGKLLVLRSF